VARAFTGRLAVFFALLLGDRASAAQVPPVFEVGLEMTNVTVTVRDARGNLVSDLTAEDFVVREDGRPQQVQVFGAAAEQIHAGEKSPRDADLHCTRCGQIVHVAAGETVRECSNGHTTFDFDERKELALNLGMLFDTSESMRPQLRLSQESAVRFLDAIPRAKDLLLVFFDRDIRISRYDSENQQGIFERILETKSGGFTALHDAIAVYLSRVWDSPGRKVLVLFSDGDDTTSSIGAPEVQRMIRSTTVTVYPVAFEGDLPHDSRAARRARVLLQALATASGGRVFQPHASKELAAIYQTILDELGSQYVLGYVSDNAARDGRYRRLVVEVKRPGFKVRCRPGYNAPKEAPAPKGK
jgi:Ca-activated chloride channel family protein